MMTIDWSKEIPSSSNWEPEYPGIFFGIESTITFYYEDHEHLCAITHNRDTREIVYSAPSRDVLPLPHNWVLLPCKESPYLLLNQNLCIDLNRNKILHTLPTGLSAEYSKCVKPEKYYEEATFTFGAYQILHKGNCGYVCKLQDKIIWSFTGRAYLYTDIKQWKNHIFFGTAGNGGYFYLIDLESGKVLLSLKTGGTRYIEQVDGLCYVLGNERTGKLFCIDLNNGSIIDECDLPGTATVNSKLQIIDQKAHAVTFAYKRGQLQSAVWSCIGLG